MSKKRYHLNTDTLICDGVKMDRIICCDDDGETLNSLCKILTGFNFEVHAVDNVDALLKMLRSKRFDLVLLDYHMGGRDGLSALAEIRQSFSPLEVPVVFLSGLQDKDQIVDLIKLGISGFLVKPPEFRTLKDKISEFIATRLTHDEVRDMLRACMRGDDPALASEPQLNDEVGPGVKFFPVSMASGKEFVLVRKGTMAPSMMATSNDLFIEKYCAVYGRFGKQWARVWPTYWMRHNAEST